MYPREDVTRFVTERFIPVRLHVKDQAADFPRYGDLYNAHWTPTILVLAPDGTEQYRIEGFVEAADFLAQLELALGKMAFNAKRWGEAESAFHEVVEQHPKTDAAAEAQYWEGVSRYRKTGNPTALIETAAAFEDRYAESAWAKKASVWRQ